ncbi:AraC family transcriptional regulator ligand-binding domain-containing protein [Candidatus Marimicrobium litorale]|uniref:HTH-type transcriptional regulator AraC-type N-terminal domain-containing protein n=1 Tax=Candidatus Marimicrobium litorale TaxID=2518991 RepID=A0ABT3TBK2_9GAMM|nr:AraC family transcriptional regulator ligand-binding domain-containing protein [Candidatus Marimicrobium litorale]MCX2979235.1 hypothetical protein [Candidatus Marimicrobium litorale]
MANETLQALAVKAFHDRLQSLGINPLEVIEAAAGRRDSATSAQSTPSVHEVLETAVAMVGDPALAIRIGEDIDLATYGTYGFALMSCSHMGAAMELFLRYGQTFIHSSSWQRSSYENGLILRLGY